MTWWLLLLGHLVGDYLCQTKWMALNKVRNDPTGYWACFVHCFIYSGILVAVMRPILPNLGDQAVMFCIAFLCHYPIDKWSLAKYWMASALGNPYQSLPGQAITEKMLVQHSIWWFVYIVIDNTSHLILMTVGIYYLFPALWG